MQNNKEIIESLLGSKKAAALAIIFSGVLVFFYMAYKSTGYYHADEHYQLIEFSGEKLGTHTSDDLVWEYHQRIRPTLQPTITFLSLSTLKVAGINDPYDQTLILRILTSLLAIFVLLYFNRNSMYFLQKEEHKSLLLFFTFFLWFMPFLSVRFSSETWSGLLFLLGIGVFIQQKNKFTFLLTGLILGISILFRYQISLCILGFSVWLIFVQKPSLKLWGQYGFGIIIALIAGTLIDSWFYKEWTIVPWRFLMAVLNTAGEGFGQSPWYFYFRELARIPNIIIGIPFLFFVIISFIYKKTNVLIWCILPFILFHLLIPHKELRFLFPLAFMMPMAITQGYENLNSVLSGKKKIRQIVKIVSILLICLNVFVLVISTQKSAGMARTTITKYIHQSYQNKPINLLYTTWHNPYNPWNSLEQIFYAENQLFSQQIKSVYDITDSLIKPDHINLLVTTSKPNIDSEKNMVLEKKGFKPVFQNIPTWVYNIIKFSEPETDIKLMTLYELQSN